MPRSWATLPARRHDEFDLIVEVEAEMITDPAVAADMAARWSFTA